LIDKLKQVSVCELSCKGIFNENNRLPGDSGTALLLVSNVIAKHGYATEKNAERVWLQLQDQFPGHKVATISCNNQKMGKQADFRY
jgi:hypothetical protein